MTRGAQAPQSMGQVLSIAGLDPSGGAGVLADIKTITMLGGYGCGVVSASTVQNTKGVLSVAPVENGLVIKQISVLLDDLDIKVIKIGMLYDAKLIEDLAHLLRPKNIPIIFDPIIKSSSGFEFLDEQKLNAVVNFLLPITTLITPNIDEAEILARHPMQNKDDIRIGAQKIKEFGVENILITGGHGKGEDIEDILFTPKGETIYNHPKIKTQNTHGTGCALSSAIATYIALNNGSYLNLPKAVEMSILFVSNALQNERTIGQGTGPLNHGFDAKLY